MPIEPWWETNPATTPRQELGMVSSELAPLLDGQVIVMLGRDTVLPALECINHELEQGNRAVRLAICTPALRFALLFCGERAGIDDHRDSITSASKMITY